MRFCEITPICSGCYRCQPELPYVDFEAFYDGPIVYEKDGRDVELVQRPVDDLYLCKDCLVQAGVMVGLGDVEKVEKELLVLRGEVAKLRSERTDAVKRLDAVHTAVEGRQSLKKPVEKKPAVKKVAA